MNKEKFVYVVKAYIPPSILKLLEKSGNKQKFIVISYRTEKAAKNTYKYYAEQGYEVELYKISEREAATHALMELIGDK